MSSRPLAEPELDRVFAALADPTRRAILARLRDGDAGVFEIAERFPMSQPAISKHLNVLERAGLISRERVARQRRCRLEAERIGRLSEWLGSYRQFWDRSFERLDNYVEELHVDRSQQEGRTE